MKFEINKNQMEKLFKLDNNLIYEIFGKEKVNILLENPFMQAFNPDLIYILEDSEGSVFKMDKFSYEGVEFFHEYRHTFRDISLTQFKMPIIGTYSEIIDMLHSDSGLKTIVFDSERKFGKWYYDFIKNKFD